MLGRMLEDEHDIKQEAISYFQQRFAPPGQPSSTPLEVNPSNVLNDEHAAWLSNDISSNEIKNALFSMNGDKSPGPDGLTACFFQHSWNIICPDFTQAINLFFRSKKMLDEVNATVVTLVPKSSQP